MLNLAVGDDHHAAVVDRPGDRNRLPNYAVINLLNFRNQTLAAG